MYAKDCKIGERFKHINCGVITVVQYEGVSYFENADGDTFRWVDNDFIADNN